MPIEITSIGQTTSQSTAQVSRYFDWVEFLKQVFGRVTSHGMFIPEIDGLRFMAILGVLVYHTTDSIRIKAAHLTFAYQDQNLLSWLFLQGNCGVPLFFIISGFILALPFIKSYMEQTSPVSLRRFYVRRLTRLEPPYIVNLLLLYFLLCVFKNMNPLELFPHLVASLFYVHNLIYSAPSMINVVAWSLEIEAQFYILAPFVFMALFQLKPVIRQLLMLGILIVTSWLRYQGMMKLSPALELSLLGKYEYFLTGILLADYYYCHKSATEKKTYLWDLVGIACWCVIPYFWSKPYLMMFLPYPAIIAYWCAFRGKLLNQFFRFTPVVLIGGMCYSIYLYHFLFISVVGERSIFWLKLDNYYLYLAVQVSLITSLSIVGCSFFFVLLEKPFMQWRVGKKTEQLSGKKLDFTRIKVQ